MIQTIKKNAALIILIISICIFIIVKIFPTKFKKKEEDVYLKVTPIQTEFGWGYSIYADDSLYIRQEFIPAISGKKGFVNKDQALTIGKLVVQKIMQKKVPYISLKELDSCHIAR